MAKSGGSPLIDASKPHIARMYDYFLGGKDWYPVDQEAAEEVKRVFPFIVAGARANRCFMRRTIRTLAAEYGVRQFVDIGTGIPTEPNLHQVAQEVAPESRVVYVDNDPTVLEYADALMQSTPQGRTAYLHADVRAGSVFDHERLRATLDTNRPIALSLVAMVHFLPDRDRPLEIVRELVGRLAPGSFLVLSHATPDFDPEPVRRAVQVYRDSGTPVQARSYTEVMRFFDGLELVDPGLVPAHRWRPGTASGLTDAECSFYGGVARVA